MSSSDTKDTGRETLNVPAVVSPERALVVDDDPQIRDVIYSALSGVGYEVDTVGSATEALKIFSRKPADLLITDWRMPGMNGIDLVNKLKKQDPHLAAILITGFGTTETVIDAFTRGKINYFLPKPFKLAEFLETVTAALRERKLKLSEREFRQRLESEIQRATRELEQKNILLQRNSDESESLYRQLQKRQEEIEGTKEYLEQLIESSLDAIISLDQNNLINFFSRGAEDMFGLDSEKIIGGSLDRLFVGGRNDMKHLLNLLAAEKSLKNFEVEMFGRGRKRIFTDISAAVLTQKDGGQGLLLIIKDISDRKKLENELLASNLNLEKLSLTDGLTDLFNHRHFQQCLTEEFQRARRFNTQLSLIMIDLDDFKLVNDTYGHQIGDQVLILIAELIRESIREVDTPARYGG
ncbi:MAG: diguanylate cyclase, partial [Thermodesulfobacteriota bacterium]|nr:diguanylate cyclase [Thermodesulfobacteriota bacterium]